GRRRYAALKFFMYTLLGSVGILVVMIGLLTTNVRDFVPQEKVSAEAQAESRGGASDSWGSVSIHSLDITTLQKAGRAAFRVQTIGPDAAAQEIVAAQIAAVDDDAKARQA